MAHLHAGPACSWCGSPAVRMLQNGTWYYGPCCGSCLSGHTELLSMGQIGFWRLADGTPLSVQTILEQATKRPRTALGNKPPVPPFAASEHTEDTPVSAGPATAAIGTTAPPGGYWREAAQSQATSSGQTTPPQSAWSHGLTAQHNTPPDGTQNIGPLGSSESSSEEKPK